MPDESVDDRVRLARERVAVRESGLDAPGRGGGCGEDFVDFPLHALRDLQVVLRRPVCPRFAA